MTKFETLVYLLIALALVWLGYFIAQVTQEPVEKIVYKTEFIEVYKDEKKQVLKEFDKDTGKLSKEVQTTEKSSNIASLNQSKIEYKAPELILFAGLGVKTDNLQSFNVDDYRAELSLGVGFNGHLIDVKSDLDKSLGIYYNRFFAF